MQILEAWEISNNHKGYQVREDAIHIFLNFKKVAVIRSRGEATSFLNKLIDNCPFECKKDFEEYKEILFRHI